MIEPQHIVQLILLSRSPMCALGKRQDLGRANLGPPSDKSSLSPCLAKPRAALGPASPIRSAASTAKPPFPLLSQV